MRESTITELDAAVGSDHGEALHPRRHPTRWIAGAASLAVMGLFVYAFIVGDIEWATVGTFLFDPRILDGVVSTVVISILALVVSLVLGVVFAVMRLSKNPVTAAVAWFYVWLFRGTPLLVQLLVWFNLGLIFPTLGIPGVADIPTIQVITPFVAALLGLSINEGAYLTEIIRGGIRSVDAGQFEAAGALGMSRWHELRHIILPQAMPAMVPPIGNEAIGLLKSTSIATVIAYGELLNRTQTIYFTNGQVMELLFVASFWYLVLTSITSVIQYYIERRYSRSSRSAQGGALDRALRTARARLASGDHA